MLLTAVTLFAADRSGPFLEAGAGVGTYYDDGRLADIESLNVLQFRAGAGAYINRYFSVALEYAQFEVFEGTTQDAQASRQYFRMLSADVAGHYPLLEEKMDLFAKFGAGEIFWDQTEPASLSSSAAVLVYGAGIGVRAVSWLTFNVGYDFYTFEMDTGEASYDMYLGSAYLDLQVQF
jgi:hypothetical protein